MVGWLVTIDIALWAGIVHNLSAGILPLRDMYPLILFASFALYLHVPLVITTLTRPARPSQPANGVAA